MAKKRTMWITTAAAVTVVLTGSAFVVHGECRLGWAPVPGATRCEGSSGPVTRAGYRSGRMVPYIGAATRGVREGVRSLWQGGHYREAVGGAARSAGPLDLISMFASGALD